MQIIDETDKVVIPIAAETLRVEKEEVVTGGVRIKKVVNVREEIVDEALFRQDADIIRVPIDRFVDSAPAIRQEGDTMVIPVIEEVLVIERRLRLTEEIHITRRSTEYRAPQTVRLRSEEAQIERWTAEDENPADTP